MKPFIYGLQVYGGTTKATAAYNPYHQSGLRYTAFAKIPSYSQGYSQYPQGYAQFPQQQQLTFAASQPATYTYSYQQQPNGFSYSPVQHHNAPQIFTAAQQIPYTHYGAANGIGIQPISPIIHAAPVATLLNSYQTPANTFYANPQQIHKIPIQQQQQPVIYNQQPQTFSVASYHHHHQQQQQPTNYNVKHQQSSSSSSSSSSPPTIINSKPVALTAPIPTSASSIEHNNGAISFSHFSQSGLARPSVAALVATSPPQTYYHQHQQPQSSYYSSGGLYNRHIQYAAVPIAASYYPTQGSVHLVQQQQPHQQHQQIQQAANAYLSKLPYTLATQQSVAAANVLSSSQQQQQQHQQQQSSSSTTYH